MKKGFTLIELLAVIVILAIIALIATPIVLNIINDTKESAILRSADFYMDAVELSIAQATLKNQSIQDGIYTITSDGNICLNAACTEKVEVEVNGESPNGGEITIGSGKIIEIALNISSKEVLYDSTTNEYRILTWVTPEDSCFETVEGSSEDTVYILSFNCDYKNQNIKIPETIGGKTVTGIVGDGLSGEKLTGIKLPNTITTIINDGLRGNNWSEITIPPNVTDLDKDSPVLDNNPNLRKIVNKTGKEFKWSYILGYPYYDDLIYEPSFAYGHFITPTGKEIEIIGPNGERGETIIPDLVTVNGITYLTTNANNLTIVGNTGNLGDVVIPETLLGRTVTGIEYSEYSALLNAGLTSITLPSTLKYIANDGAPLFYENPNLTLIVNNGCASADWEWLLFAGETGLEGWDTSRETVSGTFGNVVVTAPNCE